MAMLVELAIKKRKKKKKKEKEEKKRKEEGEKERKRERIVKGVLVRKFEVAGEFGLAHHGRAVPPCQRAARPPPGRAGRAPARGAGTVTAVFGSAGSTNMHRLKTECDIATLT